MYNPDEEGRTRKEMVQERENEVLEVIKDFYSKHHYSPTVREIAKETNIHSTCTVMSYLNKLRTKSIIDWESKSPRTIHIVEHNKKSSAS